jgi:hypothetical protein
MVNAQTKTIGLIRIGDCIVSSVAIVYFSGYGHTAKQAEAVREGVASVENAKVKIYRISETGDLPEGAFEEIGAAHAIIYGSPTYMGGPAWQFKKFADASSRPWLSQAWRTSSRLGSPTPHRSMATSSRPSNIFGRSHNSTARSGSEPVCCHQIQRHTDPLT